MWTLVKWVKFIYCILHIYTCMFPKWQMLWCMHSHSISNMGASICRDDVGLPIREGNSRLAADFSAYLHLHFIMTQSQPNQHQIGKHGLPTHHYVCTFHFSFHFILHHVILMTIKKQFPLPYTSMNVLLDTAYTHTMYTCACRAPNYCSGSDSYWCLCQDRLVC